MHCTRPWEELDSTFCTALGRTGFLFLRTSQTSLVPQVAGP